MAMDPFEPKYVIIGGFSGALSAIHLLETPNSIFLQILFIPLILSKFLPPLRGLCGRTFPPLTPAL